jgi:mannose-6-phosphate isomerase-like protein (cupin superfamily)
VLAALVNVLKCTDGTIETANNAYDLREGDFLVLPSGAPHELTRIRQMHVRFHSCRCSRRPAQSQENLACVIERD